MFGLSGTHRAKIIIVGDPNSGKTSLADRYINNHFTEETGNTIGVEYFTRSLNYFWRGKSVNLKLDIWDTAGQEAFQSVTIAYYRDANGALLVFDLGNRESLMNAQNYWFEQIQRNCPPEIPVFLVGNKADTETGTSESVDLNLEAQAFAEANKLDYFQVSAKTGTGVANLFGSLISILKGKTDQLERPKPSHLMWMAETPQETIDTVKVAPKKSCC